MQSSPNNTEYGRICKKRRERCSPSKPFTINMKLIAFPSSLNIGANWAVGQALIELHGDALLLGHYDDQWIILMTTCTCSVGQLVAWSRVFWCHNKELFFLSRVNLKRRVTGQTNSQVLARKLQLKWELCCLLCYELSNNQAFMTDHQTPACFGKHPVYQKPS